jgi:hypothetical protein
MRYYAPLGTPNPHATLPWRDHALRSVDNTIPVNLEEPSKVHRAITPYPSARPPAAHIASDLLDDPVHDLVLRLMRPKPQHPPPGAHQNIRRLRITLARAAKFVPPPVRIAPRYHTVMGAALVE